jgi:hypothetical protein
LKRTILAIMLALALVAIPVSSALAQSSEGVVVTADPLYLSISNDPDTWLINGINGTGQIDVNTTYYSNDVSDTADPDDDNNNVVDAGTGHFTVTNAVGADTCDLVITWGDFTGGDANMTNSNDGSNGATTYGAYCWYEGGAYPGVIVKDSGSDKMYTDGLAASGTLVWGVEITTRTNAWAGGTASQSTGVEALTITAVAH